MGRYSDVIAAQVEIAARAEEEMAKRNAEMISEWERKAVPLRVLVSRLNELRDDLANHNITVQVLDRTNYPVWNEWNPSLEFQIVKPNAIPPRESALYRVKCSGDRYQITCEETSGRKQGQATDHGLRLLSEIEIDSIILDAISGYPWWLQA